MANNDLVSSFLLFRTLFEQRTIQTDQLLLIRLSIIFFIRFYRETQSICLVTKAIRSLQSKHIHLCVYLGFYSWSFTLGILKANQLFIFSNHINQKRFSLYSSSKISHASPTSPATFQCIVHELRKEGQPYTIYQCIAGLDDSQKLIIIHLRRWELKFKYGRRRFSNKCLANWRREGQARQGK